MKCPECNSPNIKITDSRYYEEGTLTNAKRRTRKCKDCQHGFHTVELCYQPEEIDRVLRALEKNRANIPWTNEEDKILTEMYNNRKSRAAISAHLGRTYEGVRKRIYILGLAELS